MSAPPESPGYPQQSSLPEPKPTGMYNQPESAPAHSAMTHIPAAMIFVGLMLLAVVAFGQDGHHRFHHYYQHWKQPGTTVSCCNARMNVMGVEMGDCEPTRAEIRQGDWYAWERLTQRWLKIPDDRILKERNPSVEEGHLCFNKWTGQILCFVPPDTGG